jgi:hypothetical protein
MATVAVVPAITELDLSACHPSTIVDRINAVPGLKTSTGKLAQILFISRTAPLLQVHFSPISCRVVASSSL